MSTKLWHPFANMADISKKETIIDRGEGVWVWDTSGNRYLDATASLWYTLVGHGRAELAEAAARQMKKLAAYSTFGDFANDPALRLAERVAALSPIANAAVFFTSGGSESIETAAKLVRRYWGAVGKPERHLLITRGGSYHGVAGYGTSLAGIEPNAAGYGELIPGVICVAPDDPRAVEDVIEQHSGEVAGFFGEPVRGAGGVYPPVAGYWEQIQRICRKNDVLLVADEVITGFGRLGTWFGSSRFNIVPDIITGAKGVTSGYLPLGVVICGERVQEPFWRGAGTMFRHGYTYSGHAAACAVGIRNLEIIEKENLLGRASDLEPVLASEMQRLLQHPLIKEVRCIGLTAACEFSAEARQNNPRVADDVLAEARRNGVITRSLLGHSLQVSPPLIITREELKFMVDGFLAALNHVETEMTEMRRA
ncbi:MAG: aspartate aminotransferase family protein [Acidobacteriaceae bacterium]|nr:aspartate aminotransferase family protein [Acidobacteriaceae bacterium]MBV9780731.1 aspartate aminotransferase family protein [Acidobacteriaceae bacterium]